METTQDSLFVTESLPTSTVPSRTTISLWQPWAMLWALGEKRFETRQWSFPRKFLNQTIYIHAAQKWNSELVEYCRMQMFQEAFRRHLDVVGEDVPDHIGISYRMVNLGNGQNIKLPFGALIGKVKLVADEEVTQSLHRLPGREIQKEHSFGDFTPGRRAWIGDEHRVLDRFIGLRGAQGFFQFYPMMNCPPEAENLF